jgi:hypothetical protein
MLDPLIPMLRDLHDPINTTRCDESAAIPMTAPVVAPTSVEAILLHHAKTIFL